MPCMYDIQTLQVFFFQHCIEYMLITYENRFLMRLAIPIGYNFLILTGVEKASFYEVMGPVSYVSFLGEDFNRWVFPSCLFIMVFLSVFNIYGIANPFIDHY